MNSRTENSIKNFIWNVIYKFFSIIGPFVVRTVFIYKLGNEYMGLNSLFSSILQVLSLSELGFASASIFIMYKLIVEKNTDQICAVLLFYKHIYRIVGIVIVLLGICVIPFFPVIIKGDYPVGINLYFVYFVFLFNTAISYFLFAHKSSLLRATQHMREVSKSEIITSFLMYFIQCLILIIFKSYYLYIIIIPITTIIKSIIVNNYSNRLFPDYQCKGVIDENLKKEVFDKIPGIMASSLCNASRTTFDSIFISAYIGLEINGRYSNYFVIITSLAGIFVSFQASIDASVGNSIASESIEKNRIDFNDFSSMYMLLVGWASITIACLYQNFMYIWLGSDSLLPMSTCYCLTLYFYVSRLGDISAVYHTAAGLWKYQMPRSISETIANLILNWVFLHLAGLNGIILATVITYVVFGFVWGGRITFSHYFGKEHFHSYILKNINIFFHDLPPLFIALFICSRFGNEPSQFMIKVIFCALCLPLIYFAFHYPTGYFKKAYIKFKYIAKRVKLGDD